VIRSSQLFSGSKDIQWSYIHGLFQNAIYGGKIDNEFDNRVLEVYLTDYFNETVITGANPSRKVFGPNVYLPNTIQFQVSLGKQQRKGKPQTCIVLLLVFISGVLQSDRIHS
jgi:hypothetical protein